MLGEGWFVRGADAEHHAHALARALRRLLATDPPPWVVDGALRTGRARGQPAALAVEIRELARRSS